MNSLPGMTWSFCLVNGLGDRTSVWECEGMRTRKENMDNYLKDPKLLLLVFIKYNTFWKSNFPSFLKIKTFKMEILQVYQSDIG